MELVLRYKKRMNELETIRMSPDEFIERLMEYEGVKVKDGVEGIRSLIQELFGEEIEEIEKRIIYHRDARNHGNMKSYLHDLSDIKFTCGG